MCTAHRGKTRKRLTNGHNASSSAFPSTGSGHGRTGGRFSNDCERIARSSMSSKLSPAVASPEETAGDGGSPCPPVPAPAWPWLGPICSPTDSGFCATPPDALSPVWVGAPGASGRPTTTSLSWSHKDNGLAGPVGGDGFWPSGFASPSGSSAFIFRSESMAHSNSTFPAASRPTPDRRVSPRNRLKLRQPCLAVQCLRPVTAAYVSWYGLTLQKPNVSGPPYGFTAPRHMVLLPNAGGPSPLRHLTALYASWYGLTLQKPNVSGPPYGFTARRHMVLLPCQASSSWPSPGDGGSQTKAGPRQNIIS